MLTLCGQPVYHDCPYHAKVQIDCTTASRGINDFVAGIGPRAEHPTSGTDNDRPARLEYRVSRSCHGPCFDRHIQQLPPYHDASPYLPALGVWKARS